MNYETIDLSKDFSHQVMNFSPRFEDFDGARRKMPILGAERCDSTHFKLDGISGLTMTN